MASNSRATFAFNLRHRNEEDRLPTFALPRALIALLYGAFLALPGSAASAATVNDFLATLTTDQAQEFERWRAAKIHFDRRLDAYWYQIDSKRKDRRPKRAGGQFYSAEDYVWTFPPEFEGPPLAPDLRRRYEAFLVAAQQQEQTPTPEREVPGVDDFLAAAKQHYNFVPSRIPEREFKRRYAQEAVALGLTKDEVVRVYALETGGLGTADMQAGVNPVTRKGKPISSALGYAQLLHANTIGELINHGDVFISRLRTMAATAQDPDRVRELRAKIASLQAMQRAARSVPDDWYRHVAFAQTPRGYGMHAINLDGDIGPWLQSSKLQGLKDFAAKKGVTNLSGEEIELMNLAGPATGIEMIQPVGLTAPTTNFFSRRAYYVNKMVTGKTSAELLAEFTRRMDQSSQKVGAVEFAEVFDDVHRQGQERLPWR
jgi:hypothetical protein